MILAIIQARASSTRFPRKVLADLHGKPMLARQIERVQRSERIDKVVVATSYGHDDDEIVLLAARAEVDWWRGPLDNVFDRLYRCAENYGAEHVVRLTGDCPLIDPGVIDEVIDYHLAGRVDYTSNVEPLCFPDGLDCEIFTFDALRRAHEAVAAMREHVTTLFRQSAAPSFTTASVALEPNLAHLRWTVDTPADLEKVRRIYADLYDDNPAFTWHDIREWEEKHGD